jgi:hypothetical protein
VATNLDVVPVALTWTPLDAIMLEPVLHASTTPPSITWTALDATRATKNKQPGSAIEHLTSLVSTVTAAENATLSDANFPPADAVQCGKWKRVLVVPVFSGGSSPSIKIQLLRRAGSFWAADVASASFSAPVAFETGGRLCYFRVDTIGGAPDSVDIHILGLEAIRFDGPKGS